MPKVGKLGAMLNTDTAATNQCVTDLAGGTALPVIAPVSFVLIARHSVCSRDKNAECERILKQFFSSLVIISTQIH
jgi:hypothetical protein